MEPGYQQDQQPFDLDFGFSKQPSLPTQQADGNDDAFGLANARLEPINGRHRPKPPKYNDEDDDDEDEEDDDEDVDLGPETNVDMVDDVPEEYGKLDQAMGQNYPDEFLVNPVKTEHNDYPMDGIKNERHQNELIPESDNVADSEDSEDEWNYYRPGENNKGDTNTTAEADVSNNDLETTVIEVTSAAVSSIQEPTAPSASEINIIGHKDPSLVEKIDHSEEEHELCSPKPSEDNSNPLDNYSAASNRAISLDYEADDVTAEYDELHEKKLRRKAN